MLDKCSVNWGNVKDDEAIKILVATKEEMRNIARSRRDAITPTPMECDQVQGQAHGVREDEHNDGYSGDGDGGFYEIDAVKGGKGGAQQWSGTF